MDVYAGKACGQRSTFGLLAECGFGLVNRCQAFELFFNGRDVCVNRLFDQADLRPIELLAGTAELSAFERYQLVGEFVDLGLAVQDVAVFGGNDTSVLLALQGHLGDQLLNQFAQLFCIQTGEIFKGYDHT
jgi:hypothetical protein